jgi:hypothetical protein
MVPAQADGVGVRSVTVGARDKSSYFVRRRLELSVRVRDRTRTLSDKLPVRHEACGSTAKAAKDVSLRERQKEQRSAPCQDRTGDLQIMRLTLYQLSQRSIITQSHRPRRRKPNTPILCAKQLPPPHARVHTLAQRHSDLLMCFDHPHDLSSRRHTPPSEKDVAPPRYRGSHQLTRPRTVFTDKQRAHFRFNSFVTVLVTMCSF